MLYVFAGVLAITGVILIVVGKKKSAFKSTMSMMQTKSINQLMQADYAEIKGVAACDQPLTAPYSGLSCIYYSYRLMRRERRRSSISSTARRCAVTHAGRCGCRWGPSWAVS